MNYKYHYQTEIGKIYIAENGNEINFVTFDKTKIPKEYKELETQNIKKCYKEIHEYLNARRKTFTININPSGTAFQKKVWKELIKIPYGNTVTYKDIAKSIGNEQACRAVGMANNKNPIAIIVPCHRVIGKNGDLTGYAGGLGIKKQLLDLEYSNKSLQTPNN